MRKDREVWLVMAHHDYEGSDVVSVHKSRASAEKEAASLTEKMDRAREIRSAYWSYEAPEGEEPKWPEGVPDCDGFTVAGPWGVCA